MNFAFLIYVARSGSTLLAREIARRGGSIHVMPEFQLPDLLLREGDRGVRDLGPRRLSRLMALDPQLEVLGITADVRNRIAEELAGTGVRGVLERVVGELEPSAESVLLKKGALLEHAPALRRLFPEAKFVHVVRDPRGVANSMLRSTDPYLRGGPMGRGDPYFIARYWDRFCRRVDDVRAAEDDRLVEVSYERLLKDPGFVVRQVVEAIGGGERRRSTIHVPEIAGAERELHSLVEKPPAPARALAWREELPTWQGVTVEHLTRDGRAARGYRDYYLERRGAVTIGAYLAIGAAYHVARTAWHLAGGVFFYITHPKRIRLRIRKFLRRDERRLES